MLENADGMGQNREAKQVVQHRSKYFTAFYIITILARAFGTYDAKEAIQSHLSIPATGFELPDADGWLIKSRAKQSVSSLLLKSEVLFQFHVCASTDTNIRISKGREHRFIKFCQKIRTPIIR
jgi:hypothetical protein